jgi:uroporphyrinogen-III decarboxylase
MDRNFYLELAASGLRMPIGAHLILHEHPEPHEIVKDGRRLGGVVEQAARRFRTPLAFPLMDLTLEKAALLSAYGIAEAERESYHFSEPTLEQRPIVLTPQMIATCEAIGYIDCETDLVPVGMCIGPFSLTTKLLSDPITPVFLAGAGAAPGEEPEVALLDSVLRLAVGVILQFLQEQIAAGAKAILVCEPAANKVYFSPNQLAKSYEIFDRFVMDPNRQLKELLTASGVDLIFHDCGELLDDMVRRFTTLDPAILSLGSSRKLWDDAALVPKTTILFGNLPTKRFYSDALISLAEVRRLSVELPRRMRAVDHPFILGSECDVLSVPGRERTILEKVEAFLQAEDGS